MGMSTMNLAVVKNSVCACGHDRTLHDVLMHDKICNQVGCVCWNFDVVKKPKKIVQTSDQAKARWKKLEEEESKKAKKRTKEVVSLD